MTLEYEPTRRSIDNQFEIHMVKEELRNKEQDAKLENIEKELFEIKSSIKGLLSAWDAANTVGNFLKWIAAASAGIVVVIETIRHFGK